jgi:hypothetical protein
MIDFFGRHFIQTLLNLPALDKSLALEVLFEFQRVWKISWNEEPPKHPSQAW